MTAQSVPRANRDSGYVSTDSPEQVTLNMRAEVASHNLHLTLEKLGRVRDSIEGPRPEGDGACAPAPNCLRDRIEELVQLSMAIVSLSGSLQETI